MTGALNTSGSSENTPTRPKTKECHTDPSRAAVQWLGEVGVCSRCPCCTQQTAPPLGLERRGSLTRRPSTNEVRLPPLAGVWHLLAGTQPGKQISLTWEQAFTAHTRHCLLPTPLVSNCSTIGWNQPTFKTGASKFLSPTMLYTSLKCIIQH